VGTASKQYDVEFIYLFFIYFFILLFLRFGHVHKQGRPIYLPRHW